MSNNEHVVTRIVINPRLNTSFVLYNEEENQRNSRPSTPTTPNSMRPQTPTTPTRAQTDKQFVFVDEGDNLREDRSNDRGSSVQGKRLKEGVDFFKKKEQAYSSMTNYFKFQ